MQDGRLVLESNRSPFFEIAGAGPDDREYDPEPRRVTASADALAALASAGGVASAGPVRRRGKGSKFEQVGTSAAAKARMVERFKQLGSVLLVAREFGASVTRVREILKLAGVDLRQAINKRGDEMGGPRTILTEEQERVMVQRYAAGESSRELCIEFKVGIMRLQELVEKYGHVWRGRGGVRRKGSTDGEGTGRGVATDEGNTDGEMTLTPALSQGERELGSKDREGLTQRTRRREGERGETLTPTLSQGERGLDGVIRDSAAAAELEATLAGMVVGVEELDVQPRRSYNPPAVVRSGDLWSGLRPVQPEPMVFQGDGLAQLGRLSEFLREIKAIEGVQVAGSVNISLSVELPL